MSGSSCNADTPSIPPIAFVLDDNAQITALVGKILEMCGVCPRQFTAPEPVLVDIESSLPDLIILDLSLGISDAVEVMRNLERLEYGGKVPLVGRCGEAILGEITQIGVTHGLTMHAREVFRAAGRASIERRGVAPRGLVTARGEKRGWSALADRRAHDPYFFI